LSLKYQNVVIGSSLTAVMFAFIRDYPLLYTKPAPPFRFDYFAPDIQFLDLKIPGAAKSLTTFDQDKQVGIRKEILWERLLFLMGLRGHVVLPGIAAHLRCDTDRIIASNEYSKIAEVQFETCHYFDESNTSGFITKKSVAEPTYVCYDWIAFHRGGKHDIDYFSAKDDFVHQVWFYPSDRIDGATLVKDACVVSKLTQTQLLDFDYSETMARFKLIHEMESRGMKGLFNGYSQNGKPKYYKFRTSGIARTKSEQQGAITPQASNIKMPKVSEEDLLKDLPSACLGYDRFLRWL